jgi:hypothetical protein
MDHYGTKMAVVAVVEEYIREFPKEFAAFQQHMKQQRAEAKNEFAELKEADYLRRKLCEYPTTLSGLITLRLDEDDDKWFQSKDGQHWFAKKFPDFAAGDKT